MFSFSGYAEVVEDLPPFLDDNLRKCLILQRINQYLSKRVSLTETTGPILRSSTRRARNRVEPQSECTSGAQAEIFVAEKRSIGHQKEQLKGMIEEEVEVNRDTGNIDPLFLRYCLRILRNMRNAGNFSADVAHHARAHDGLTITRDGANKTQEYAKSLTDRCGAGQWL